MPADSRRPPLRFLGSATSNDCFTVQGGGIDLYRAFTHDILTESGAPKEIPTRLGWGDASSRRSPQGCRTFLVVFDASAFAIIGPRGPRFEYPWLVASPAGTAHLDTESLTGEKRHRQGRNFLAP